MSSRVGAVVLPGGLVDPGLVRPDPEVANLQHPLEAHAERLLEGEDVIEDRSRAPWTSPAAHMIMAPRPCPVSGTRPSARSGQEGFSTLRFKPTAWVRRLLWSVEWRPKSERITLAFDEITIEQPLEDETHQAVDGLPLVPKDDGRRRR